MALYRIMLALAAFILFAYTYPMPIPMNHPRVGAYFKEVADRKLHAVTDVSATSTLAVPEVPVFGPEETDKVVQVPIYHVKHRLHYKIVNRLAYSRNLKKMFLMKTSNLYEEDVFGVNKVRARKCGNHVYFFVKNPAAPEEY